MKRSRRRASSVHHVAHMNRSYETSDGSNTHSPPRRDDVHSRIPPATNFDGAPQQHRQHQQPAWGGSSWVAASPPYPGDHGYEPFDRENPRGLFGQFFRSMMNRMENFGREFNDMYFNDGHSSSNAAAAGSGSSMGSYSNNGLPEGSGGDPGMAGRHHPHQHHHPLHDPLHYSRLADWHRPWWSNWWGSDRSSAPSSLSGGRWFDDPFFQERQGSLFQHPRHRALGDTWDRFLNGPFSSSWAPSALQHQRAIGDDDNHHPSETAANSPTPLVPRGSPPLPTGISEMSVEPRSNRSIFGGNANSLLSLPPSCIPRVDVRDTGNALLVHADLPGMRKEDVKVDVKDGVLTISGAREDKREDSGSNCYRQERCQSRFHRSLTLPPRVNEADIRASFDHGVLEVQVPHDPVPLQDDADARRRIPIE